MSKFIEVNNRKTVREVVDQINNCSFFGNFLTNEEGSELVESVFVDNIEHILFDTGLLISVHRNKGGKFLAFGRLDGDTRLEDYPAQGMFFRNETLLVEKEGESDTSYSKLLKSLINHSGEGVETAIWCQHICLSDKYIPEMEAGGNFYRALKDDGITDEKNYTVALKDGEKYTLTSISIAYHESGVEARSVMEQDVNEDEFKKIVEIINS